MSDSELVARVKNLAPPWLRVFLHPVTRRYRRWVRRRAMAKCRTAADLLHLVQTMVQPIQVESEILGLIELAARHRPAVICEIGLAYGGTAMLLHNALKPKTYIGVDLEISNRELLTDGTPAGSRLHLIGGASTDASTLARVDAALAGRKIDLILIDGDHSLEGVRSDFLAYRSRVAPDGLVVFHDIVACHLDRFGVDHGGRTGGVPQFFAQLKPHYPHTELVDDPDQDGYGIGVIHYNPTVALPHAF